MNLDFTRTKDFWEKRNFNIIKTELLFLHATAEHRQSWLTRFTYEAISLWSNLSSIDEFEEALTKTFNETKIKNIDSHEKIIELEDTYAKMKATTSVFNNFLNELDKYFENIKTEREELVFDILSAHLITLHNESSERFKTIIVNQAVDSDSFRILASYYNKSIPNNEMVAGELIDLMYDILNWTVTLYGELLDLQVSNQDENPYAEIILQFVRETGTTIYFFLYFAESILDEFDIGEERISELLEYENDKWNEISGYENIENIKTHLLNN